MTRAEEQARIDTEFALGLLSRHEWSLRFDELSNVRLWSAWGRVK